MKSTRILAWLAILIGVIYFIVPLIGTFEFSLRMRRGEYSFDAYQSVFSDIQFRTTFGFSMLMALFTIVFGMLPVVPTAYWVRLRLPRMRPVVEFITLLPLVIPAIGVAVPFASFGSTSACAAARTDNVASAAVRKSPVLRWECIETCCS